MNFEEYIAASEAVIATWPEWKKGSLGPIAPYGSGSILPPPLAETVEDEPKLGVMGNRDLPKPAKIGLWFGEPGTVNFKERPADWRSCFEFEVVFSDADSHPGIFAWTEEEPPKAPKEIRLQFGHTKSSHLVLGSNPKGWGILAEADSYLDAAALAYDLREEYPNAAVIDNPDYGKCPSET